MVPVNTRFFGHLVLLFTAFDFFYNFLVIFFIIFGNLFNNFLSFLLTQPIMWNLNKHLIKIFLNLFRILIRCTYFFPKYICIFVYYITAFAHIMTMYSTCEVVSKVCNLFGLVANLDRDLSALFFRNWCPSILICHSWEATLI